MTVQRQLRAAVRGFALLVALTTSAFAQDALTATPAPIPVQAATMNDRAPSDFLTLEAVRRQLQQQQAEIERLRDALEQQSRLVGELLQRTNNAGGNAGAAGGVTPTEATYATRDVAAADSPNGNARGASQQSPATSAATLEPQPDSVEARVKRLETQAQKSGETLNRVGALTFSGDLRLRYEGQFGQLNALPNAANPNLVGNELSSRNRARLRARFAVRGQIGKQFDWGLRFATGTFPDVTTSNQTLTDFFTRKSFALDQAFVTYRPSAVPGLRLQGGKFETPWLATELTWDVDIQPEGINESYSRDFKKSSLQNLTFVAWQLPLLERQAAFVLGTNGQVNLDASRRGGRDLALYGAQARARFGLTPHAALTLSAANLYFSGTQFITPAQVFGAQFQIPITVNLSATANAPAQTVTALANVPRDLLVAGANLGVSVTSTNATNRDGRLSSGYNLVDLIARLDVTASQRFPVALLFNFVRNTQTRDVVVAAATGGALGANRLLHNGENSGYWAQAQVGKTKERGDALFDYTFIRIERDAVLSPFNFSDIVQSTDVRAHRLTATYAVDPRVLLSVTGIFSQRPNGLLGAFGATPPGSLERASTRLQLDTVFRF